MKILMVYPRYPDTFWGFKHALKFISKKTALPPLGLVTIASYLPKEWDIKLVDMNAEKLSESDVKNSDYVFISAMTIQRESAKEVIKMANNLGTPVVAGGPLFTMEPDHFPNVDHFVLGEAEEVMSKLVNDIEKGEVKHYYASPRFPDIKKTPVPRWDLLNLKWYASMSLQFSRGCPYNCEFCDIGALNGRVPRSKDTEQVIRELQSLYDAGWRKAVFFVDDNFIGKKVVLKKEVLPAVIRWQREHGDPFTFYTEVSVDLSDDEELMNLMQEAGFNRVFVGIETPDPDSLQEANKYQNIKHDLKTSIQKMQSHGFDVQGGFIVGFDNDRPTIFERQFNFIQEVGIVTAMMGILNAPRGSALYERMRKEKRLIGEITGDNVNISTNFIPKMDPKVLIEGYKKLVSALYTPKNYYKRLRKFLSVYNLPKLARPKIDFNDVKAFLKSMVFIGVFGKERKEYWKALMWSLFKKPKYFSTVVAFAIYGYHFRKIAEKVARENSEVVVRELCSEH
ncbi:B12-binding domain-containing radical SAM protein [Mesoaciditoga lauensis]|uniref:B12-binding domain-containing radical SAM protein n=1 Tax=Mesoaciditoga lauensis TaxID=1495039 RepID=UPI000689308A|nr:B12-binding domain-containing radical SAM protein [Mesoaciditoga lauensis]